MSDYPKITTKAWQQIYRRLLPYGMWTLPNGDQVLFNRNYDPIRIRSKVDGAVNVCHPHWVDGVTDENTVFFYQDDTSPIVSARTHALVAGILADWDNAIPAYRPIEKI